MPLVYGLGLGFVFGIVGSFVILFLVFKYSLKPSFIPKVEEKKEFSVGNLVSVSGKFFRYREVSEPSFTEDSQDVAHPSFVIKGIIFSEKLRGVFLREGNGIFFLEEGKSYKGYTLIKVGKKDATFRRGNKLFTLRFEPTEGNKTLARSANVINTPKEIVISRREIERITKDPAKMFTQIRLVPYIKNGRTEGFIFEWVKPGSLFHRLGIRKGDILVSINNMTITSGEDAFRILQMIRNEPNLKVVLIRKGKREEIDVRIE